jgi:hypothetical protein
MTVTSNIKFVELPVATQAEATSGYEINGKWQHVLECALDSDGDVLVNDTVAGHYTRCHSLSEAQQNEVRRLASV